MNCLNVTRAQVVARGLTNRCPNCGGRTLFKQQTFFQLNAECPACGLKFARDDGFFLGATWLNYGVTVICFLAPMMFLAYEKVIGETMAIVLAGAGSIVVPMLIFRSSRSWWLLSYYFVLPQQLPANQSTGNASHNQNV
jgi:uncharacterized protein (DUF983 family)